MDGWPKVQLVATPDVGATVLYNFNTTRKSHAGHDGFDTGAPTWGGRPGQPGGTDGYRTVRFTHYIDGSDTAAVTALVTLGKLLTAASGWLLIQMRAASEPTWARVWRSTPGALSWDRVLLNGAGVTGKYAIDVALEADPYLYGALTTLANGVTLNNDPASGTNPCRIVLATVLGDAPTPAIVKATSAGGLSTDEAWHLTHVSTGPPIFWQVGTADGWTVTNFAAASASANWSGGSYRATTATPAELLQNETVQPGRYLVMVRAGESTGTGVWKFTFYPGWPLTNAVESEPYQVVTGAAVAQWHPIGITTIPVGSPLTDTEAAAEATIAITPHVLFTRVSGTGNINVDVIALIPVTNTSTSMKWGATGNGAATAETIDGELERIVARDTGTSVLITRPFVVVGGFPVLQPSGTNTLHFYVALAGGGTVLDRADTLGYSHTVTVTYRPWWLWPRP